VKPVRVIAGAALVAAAVLAPIVLRSTDGRLRAAQALCLLAAAIGLALAVGDAGLPSLAQGAFVGTGAYVTAVLRHRYGMAPPVAVVLAVMASLSAGLILSGGVRRFRGATVALTTWIAAWLFIVVIGAFPAVTGGSRGIVVAPPVQRVATLGITLRGGPMALYEVAVAVALLALGVVAAVRHRYGESLSASRTDPSAARAAGVPVQRLLRMTFVVSAGIGGLAGAVYVHAAGVADPTAYGPLLSVTLLIAVLIGGARSMAGPAVGLLALVVVSRFGGFIATEVRRDRARVEPVAAAVLLVPALLIGGSGVVQPRRRRRDAPTGEPADAGGDTERWTGGSIRAHMVSVRFGGLQALDGVDLTVQPGTCHALIGANGSGKSTLLKVLARLLPPGPDGSVTIEPPRVARTLQRLAVAPDLTAFEHVVAGAESARATGIGRAILSTPMSRGETRRVRERALARLADVGLAGREDVPAGQLNGAERRLVQVARALAADPNVLLLDEPAAGLSRAEREHLVGVLRKLRDGGLTMVVVEHDLGFVEALADAITQLDAGRVVTQEPV
jgi:branched-chain amino acid transport system permease protein